MSSMVTGLSKVDIQGGLEEQHQKLHRVGNILHENSPVSH